MQSYPLKNQQNNSKPILNNLQYPCRFHKGQICLNYCIDDPCFKPLCSQCIEEHLHTHQQNRQSDLSIKTFKGVRGQSLIKITKLIQDLYAKMSSVTPLQNPQEVYKDLLMSTDEIKRSMHDAIQKQFIQIQQQVKSKMNHSINVMKNVQQSYGNLLRVIQQLKQHQQILIQGRFDPNYRLGAYAKMQTSVSSDVGLLSKDVSESIQKIIRLNHLELLEGFDKQIHSYENLIRQIKFGISCDFDFFKKSIHESLKLFDFYQNDDKSRFKAKFNYEIIQNSRAIGNVSKSPLKRDASSSSIISKSIVPSYSNIYQILHFFESGSNKLHIIKFNNQKPIHKEIDLGQYVIPNFHASLLTENGQLFLTGGSIEIGTTVKIPKVIKYSLQNNQLVKEFTKVLPRSSHSLCQDGQWLYISGGYGQQNNEQTTFLTDFQRVNMTSKKYQKLASSNWGGWNISFVMKNHVIKICQDGVQAYNIKANKWLTFSGSKLAFNNACGFFKLNENQVLVFGGYSLKNDQQVGIKNCSLWTFNIAQKTFKINNLQNKGKLPIGQGFWNNQGISDGQNIYVLQNIQDQQVEEGQYTGCIDNQRNLLKFNGLEWEVIKTQWNHH